MDLSGSVHASNLPTSTRRCRFGVLMMNDYVTYFLLFLALVGLPLAWWRAKAKGQLERDASKPLFTRRERWQAEFWKDKLIEFIILGGLLLVMLLLAKLGVI